MLSKNQSVVVRFSYEGGAREKRKYPCRIPWRQLPYTLLESPEGGNWILELEGVSPVTVYSGEIMVIPRGVRHAFRMAGSRVMYTDWAMFCFDGWGGTDFLAAANIPPVLPRSAGKSLIKLMATAREFDSAIGRGDLSAIAKQHQAGFRILEVLLNHAKVRTVVPADPEMGRMLPVLQHVEANLSNPILTAELAHKACLSLSRFYVVFRRLMGVSPIAFVLNARLRAAQHLLLTTSLTVGEVATRTGFASHYYFSRAFRRNLKTTPTDFRQDFSYYHLHKSEEDGEKM